MALSSRARVSLALVVVLLASTYLVIVDLGISAGRVHHGVTVGGVEVGGLSFPEAFDALEERGRALQDEPVVFVTEGFNAAFLPTDVGWTPQPFDTTEKAMRVGRDDAPLGALKDRLRAWFGGVKVGWAGRPNPRLVTELIDEWDLQLRALGVTLDRGQLRYRMRRAIEMYPRRPAYSIPVQRS